jgi:hypothetical protein
VWPFPFLNFASPAYTKSLGTTFTMNYFGVSDVHFVGNSVQNITQKKKINWCNVKVVLFIFVILEHFRRIFLPFTQNHLELLSLSTIFGFQMCILWAILGKL